MAKRPAIRQDKDCGAVQFNRHAPDFSCVLREGHTEPHRDPKGAHWRGREMRPFRKGRWA